MSVHKRFYSVIGAFKKSKKTSPTVRFSKTVNIASINMSNENIETITIPKKEYNEIMAILKQYREDEATVAKLFHEHNETLHKLALNQKEFNKGSKKLLHKGAAMLDNVDINPELPVQCTDKNCMSS